jgi:hypothetical protein
MGRRIGAWVIDSIVIAIPGVALAASQLEYLTEDRLAEDGVELGDFCDELSERDTSYACAEVGNRVYFDDDPTAVPVVAGLGMTLVLLVILQGLTGATVGKALFGLRTVGEDGQRPGIGKALVRTLLWIVDAAPWCLPLVGFITGLTTTGHRRVGDMAARTFVVRSSDTGAPIAVPGLAGTVAPTTAPAWPPPSMPPTAPPASSWPPPSGPASWPPPSGEPADVPVTDPDQTATLTPDPTQPIPQPASQPQWDAARGTYIIWDANRSAWLQWDERSSTWVPITV